MGWAGWDVGLQTALEKEAGSRVTARRARSIEGRLAAGGLQGRKDASGDGKLLYPVHSLFYNLKQALP